MTTSVASSLRVEPVRLGPSWQRDENGWLLPELSLGYEIAGRWIPENLQNPDGTPFRLTQEQTRLLVWWYAVDGRGRFVFRDGVVQRIKGWGKDPLAAVIAAVEFVGPCRVARMDDGPVAVENPAAWVQVAATSKDQTRNTMTLFPALFSKSCERDHGIDMGKEIIYAHKGACRIEAVTSSPRALEGGRPSFTIANETQHWLEVHEGHAMWAVIQRNAMKAPEGSSRVLAITNAYNPAEDSIAQRTREAWERLEAGGYGTKSLMYDSLEAPPETPVHLPRQAGESSEDHSKRTLEHIASVIEVVRGDSTWVDPESYARFVLDSRTPPSEARRFAFNQITATEDAWLDPLKIDLTVSRPELSDIDEWVMFFDGSKSDDSTGLTLCRLSDGHVVTGGVWEKPPGRDGWQVDRYDVDQKVRGLFDENKIVAFWADPSHVKDDDGYGYWDALIDGWHRDFGDVLTLWSVQSGANQHSVLWDMSTPAHQKMFTAAAQEFVEDVEASTADKKLITHDGHPLLVQHLRNARRAPNRYGVSLMKEHRESLKKIDLAVCAVGARMLRRLVLNKGERPKPGKLRRR